MSFNPDIHQKIIIDGMEKGYRLKTTTQSDVIRAITIGSFRLRFSIDEKVAIETSTDPVVKVLQRDMQASSHIDLDNADLLNGLNYFESVGILKAGRIAELTANGQPSEAFVR